MATLRGKRKLEEVESISFTSATREQIESFLKLDLRTVDSAVYTLRLPPASAFPRLAITDYLVDNLTKDLRLHHMNSEASNSGIIKLLLKDAVLQVADGFLKIVQESNEKWENDGVRFNGYVDYSIKSNDNKSQLIVTEVKGVWDEDEAETQLLAEAGALLCRRLDDGKNTPVFGVLSNAKIFKFYVIDDRDRSVYSSGLVTMQYRPGTDFRESEELKEIVTWLRWFLTVITSISRRSSPATLSDDGILSSLQELRRNF